MDSKQESFNDSPLSSLDSLLPPSFIANEPQQYRSFPSSALDDGSAFTYNAFQEDQVYRSVDFSAVGDHSLSAQTTRAIAQDGAELSDDTHRGFADFETMAPATFGGQKALQPPLSALSAFSLKHQQPQHQLNHPSFSAAADSSFAPAGKALSAPQVAIVVEPPPVPGGYLEPSYHMHSSAHPQALLQTVRALLQASPAPQCQVDCVLKLDKFKLKCNAYRNGAKIPFCVRLFTTAESLERRYALEFQRRSGDVTLFNEIYRNMKKALMAKKLVESVKTASFEPAPAAFLLECDVSTDQHKQTLKCLTQMAASSCVDVKMEALLSMAELSCSDPQVQSLMAGNGELVESLIDELGSKQEDVHRCALTTLANLAKPQGGAPQQLGEHVCQRIFAASGALKRVLSLAQSSDCPEVVRESSRLLARIGGALGKKVCDREFCEVLQSIRCCPDARARENVSELLDSLRL